MLKPLLTKQLADVLLLHFLEVEICFTIMHDAQYESTLLFFPDNDLSQMEEHTLVHELHVSYVVQKHPVVVSRPCACNLLYKDARVVETTAT